MNLQALAGGPFPIPEALMSKPFVYYCKQDPWQDDLDGNHGLLVLLARRSDEPGSEAIWSDQQQAWQPFPDLLERYFGAAAVAGSSIRA